MRPTSTTSLSHGLRAVQSSLVPRTALSRSALRPFSQLISSRSTQQFPRKLAPQSLQRPSIPAFGAIRANSSKPLTDRVSDPATDAQNEEQNRQRREQEPAYQITFTCKPCGNRSSHRMSKHGYHRGTVVIRCPSCKNRHIISDHLNIFFDKKSTLEDILEQQGDKLTRGYVEGDMEFWEDGSVKQKESSTEKSDQEKGQLP